MEFTDFSHKNLYVDFISNLFSESELSGNESELSVGVEELMDPQISDAKRRYIYIYIVC